MNIRSTTKHRFALSIIAASLMAGATPAFADTTYQTLPFAQNWSNTGLITANGNWSGVPGIVGYRGDSLTGSTGTNPQTILASGTDTPVDVQANQSAPNTFSTGGVAEFHLSNPTIALNGSGTADAPFILLHLNTTGANGIKVAYNLRDLDGSADNAVQPIALQYRIGSSGNFIDVPAAFVADATEANTASTVTPVSVTLPAAADNQAQLQLRIITSNAVGNDEWVGIDDITVTAEGGPNPDPINQPIVTVCPAGSMAAGEAGGISLSATDADSRVNSVSLAAGTPAGFSLGTLSSAVAEGGSASVTLNVSNSLAVGNYPVVVNFGNDELQSASCTVNVTVTGVTQIHTIQGSGKTSPLVGQSVTTQGVVTKLNSNGFFMQGETPDSDETTSEGIFVFTSSTPSVAVGQRLRVAATVTEYNVGAAGNAGTLANLLTQLTAPVITTLASGIAIEPKRIVFPEVVEGDLEHYEGMLVRIEEPLTVSQNFFLGRYGQMTVSAGGRLVKPTNRHPAGSPEALALADDNARRRLLLDDGSSLQNPNPTPYLGADNTVRAGDTIEGLVGVIDYGLATNNADGLSDYRLHPVEVPVITRSNPRMATPEVVGGNVKVASFNVLNYFTTIDQAGASCYPGGTRSDCRGADSVAEFTRQKSKIVKALASMNADVVGLMEIENNGNTAVLDLVAGLNAQMGAGTYASIALPSGGTGTDAIRVAMIYKPSALSLVGNARSDTQSIHNRPPLAQTFAAANGEKFSVVVNHFKSKGSCPSGGADADQGDGQGCWNALRVSQAQALRGFVQSLQASTGDDDVIVMGDLNAYGKEDPILDFTDNGYVDQVARFAQDGYSYVFDGESGYLDHALATPSLNAQIVTARHWRINADEPSIIDYNLEFKQPACPACGPDYFSNTVYRSSDHDPVLIGLRLLKPVSGSAGRDALQGSAGDDRIEGGIGADVLTGGAGRDRFIYTSLRDAGDTITDFVPGEDVIDLSALLASIGYSGSQPVADGHVKLVSTAAGVSLQIDTDAYGPAPARPLLLLKGLTVDAIQPLRDIQN